MKTWDETKDRIEGGEIVSPKLDGIYARATADGMVTRSGKPITTQPGVWKRLAAHFKKNPQATVEGELYRDGQPFQQTVSDFKGGRGLDYHVFPSDGPKPRKGGGIFHVRGEKVRDAAGADERYRNAQAAGYEGVVIRKADGTLIKRKPMQDSEYTITGGSVGKKHGILSVTDGKRSFRVQAPADVATNAPVGKLATIGYFRKTLSGKPHAPVFKAVRDYENSSKVKLMRFATPDTRILNGMNRDEISSIAAHLASRARSKSMTASDPFKYPKTGHVRQAVYAGQEGVLGRFANDVIDPATKHNKQLGTGMNLSGKFGARKKLEAIWKKAARIGINMKTKLKTISFSDKGKKHMNPYIGAALSGGLSGAVLGFTPILKNGVKLRTALKSAAVTGAASAGIVGGGSLLGSKIIGAPKEGENSPFLKRAALGGTIAGAGAGVLGAIAARKIPFVKSGVANLAKEWRPAKWMQSKSAIKAAGIGGISGAAIGAYQGSDEGAQVDTINSIKKANAENMKKKQFSVGGKVITFGFVQDESGVPLTGRVSRDRFVKKVNDDDLRRRDKNMIRTTLIGAGAGALLGGKGRLMKGAAIGGGAGLVSVPLVRAITARGRDVYGERTHEGKIAEHIPAVAGLGLAGYGAYKLAKARFNFEAAPIMSQQIGGRAILDKKRDHMDNIRDAALIGTGGAMTIAAIHQTAMIRDLDKTSQAAAKSIEAAKTKVAKKVAKVSRFFAPGLGKKSASPIIRIGRKLVGMHDVQRLLQFEERKQNRVRDFLNNTGSRALLTGAGLVTGGWIGAVGGKEVARRVANATGTLVKKGEKLKEGTIVWRRGNDPILGAINHYGVVNAQGTVSHFSPKGMERHKVGRFAKKNDMSYPVYKKDIGSKRIGDDAMYDKKPFCFIGRNCQDAAQRLAGHQFPIWEDQVGSAIAGAVGVGSLGAYATNKAANDLKKKHEFAVGEQPQRRNPWATAGIAGGVTLGGVAGVVIGRRAIQGIGRVEKAVTKSAKQIAEHTREVHEGVKKSVENMKNTTAIYHDAGKIYRVAKGGAYNLLHPIQTAGEIGREIKYLVRGGAKAGLVKPARVARPEWAQYGSNGKLILFYDKTQPRLKGTNTFAPVLGSLARRDELVDADGNPFQMTNHHVASAAWREGKKYRVGAQRTYRVGRDISDVIQGKPKEPGRKREWEKAWVGNAIAAGAVGLGALGVVGLRRYARMPGNAGKGLSKMVLKAEDKIASAKDAVVKKVGDFVDAGIGKMGLKENGAAATATKAAKGPKRSKVVPGNFSSLQKQIQFDIWAQERGWDLRDARGKSARVYAPGSRRRVRRLADWKETKEGQRKILIGAGVAGGLAATAIGSTIAYKLGGRGAMKQVGVLENKLAKVERAKKGLKTKAARAGVRAAFNPKVAAKPLASARIAG
jgi:hypothetical protein